MRHILVIQLLLYITITHAVPTVVHKCCPNNFAISVDRQDGVERCVQHVDRRSTAWHPRINVEFETAIPRTVKESMTGLRDHCAHHNWITTDLTGNEVIQPDTNGELQMVVSRNFFNYFGPETCFDQLLEDGNGHRMTSLVSINCPCFRQQCVYLCCGEAEHEIDIERQNSFENQKCGYTEAEWRGALQTVLADSSRMNVLETESPTAMCLQETQPYYRIGHPDIVTVSEFRVQPDGYLVTKDVRLPSAHFCLGLTKTSSKSLKVTAYYCSKEQPIQSTSPQTDSPNNEYPNYPNNNGNLNYLRNPNNRNPNNAYINQSWNGPSHAWLAGLGAVLTVITLIRVVLSPKLREGAQGILMVGFCIFMLWAYICIAYLPTATKSNTFIDTSSKACITLAVLIHYSLIASFAWLNERTVLIQGDFRTWKSQQVWLGNGKNQVWWKLLLLVSLLTAVPAIAPIVGAVQMKFRVTPENPNNLNNTLCWFITWMDYILLYALPFIITHAINLLFVGFNFYQMYRAESKTPTNSPPPTQEDVKADKITLRRSMVAELVFTGLWIAEVICFAFDHYWYSLSGVLVVRSICVFLIFCCTSETWGAIKSTLCHCCMTEGSLELSDQSQKKKKNGENPFEEQGMAMETYEKPNTM